GPKGRGRGLRGRGEARRGRWWRGCARRWRLLSMSADAVGPLRRLPSVDQLVRLVAGRPEVQSWSRPRLTAAARELLGSERYRVGAEGRPPEAPEALPDRLSLAPPPRPF